jgi:muramoyltetrapeptide carboxypeptidase
MASPHVIKPRALEPGDTLGVVSPASSIDEDRLFRGIALIESRGYRTKLFPHTLDQVHYLAGTDQDRAADLMAAIDDPGVDAVICSRGGYGCARLLPYIDLDRIVEARKMILGFSDITTLHLALNKRGLVTMHTPMPITLSYERAPWVVESFFSLLAGDATTPQEAPNSETITPGVAEGPVVGGCLCLLCDSIGTPEGLETDGKILVIEDVDENPHRVDAMFTHLINSGLLAKCAGVCVGEMTNTDDRCDPTMGGKPWREIVSERVASVRVPAVLNFPFGHMKTMRSIPLGIRARLDASAGTLTYLESPCEPS